MKKFIKAFLRRDVFEQAVAIVICGITGALVTLLLKISFSASVSILAQVLTYVAGVFWAITGLGILRFLFYIPQASERVWKLPLSAICVWLALLFFSFGVRDVFPSFWAEFKDVYAFITFIAGIIGVLTGAYAIVVAIRKEL
jgi:hypothetical protein